ncbi:MULTISPECIES: helix-turn-helix domain-containing protein [unclassified Pseudomonas]|uniref:AraC family transcriptional regulator n=1 Tax=unclassified Pseudomonas TaxID=196821 RepID=UPI0035C26E49
MHSLLPRSPYTDLPGVLDTLRQIEPLLDAMPEVVFFIKDTATRYALVNQTLVQRLGVRSKQSLLGMTAEQVFPASFGPSYTAQDRRVLEDGSQLNDQLELHLYYGSQPVWCLTHKLALRNPAGEIIGVAGISRDVQLPQSSHPAYPKLAAVDAHIREHFARPISLTELTELAGLSVAQLERHCKRIFQLTPRQMIHKARLGEASRLLQQDLPITEIALRCGYTDHSAFSRQFRALTGLTPSQFRLSHQR